MLLVQWTCVKLSGARFSKAEVHHIIKHLEWIRLWMTKNPYTIADKFCHRHKADTLMDTDADLMVSMLADTCAHY